ncbi:hypothetical protein TNCV_574491 [Trichonephila clavipes]|nr:hypothetical protein TNCV_574491 [Trichonephila clavipes]
MTADLTRKARPPPGRSFLSFYRVVKPLMATPNAVTLSVSLNIALFMGKKGAIASRRLDFYLLVHGRYFISLLPPIGNQWRRSPIRHLGTGPLGVTGSPKGNIGIKKLISDCIVNINAFSAVVTDYGCELYVRVFQVVGSSLVSLKTHCKEREKLMHAKAI